MYFQEDNDKRLQQKSREKAQDSNSHVKKEVSSQDNDVIYKFVQNKKFASLSKLFSQNSVACKKEKTIKPREHKITKREHSYHNYPTRGRTQEIGETTDESQRGSFAQLIANSNLGRKYFASEDRYHSRYVNERVEQELLEFKDEIDKKFRKSQINKDYEYPRYIHQPPSNLQPRFVNILNDRKDSDKHIFEILQNNTEEDEGNHIINTQYSFSPKFQSNLSGKNFTLQNQESFTNQRFLTDGYESPNNKMKEFSQYQTYIEQEQQTLAQLELLEDDYQATLEDEEVPQWQFYTKCEGASQFHKKNYLSKQNTVDIPSSNTMNYQDSITSGAVSLKTMKESIKSTRLIKKNKQIKPKTEISLISQKKIVKKPLIPQKHKKTFSAFIEKKNPLKGEIIKISQLNSNIGTRSNSKKSSARNQSQNATTYQQKYQYKQMSKKTSPKGGYSFLKSTVSSVKSKQSASYHMRAKTSEIGNHKINKHIISNNSPIKNNKYPIKHIYATQDNRTNYPQTSVVSPGISQERQINIQKSSNKKRTSPGTKKLWKPERKIGDRILKEYEKMKKRVLTNSQRRSQQQSSSRTRQDSNAISLSTMITPHGRDQLSLQLNKYVKRPKMSSLNKSLQKTTAAKYMKIDLSEVDY